VIKENKFLRGSIFLAISAIVAKCVGFLFKIPLTNMVGAEAIGIFNYGHTLYMTMLAIALTGIPYALSKIVAEKIANHREREAHRLFKLTFVIMFFGGLMLSLLLLIITDFFVGWFWPEETYIVLVGLVFSPFFVALSAAFKGYFLGLEKSQTPAIAQLVDGIIRLIVGLGLTYVLLNSLKKEAILGAAIGVTIGSLLSLVVYLIDYLKIRRKLYREVALRDNYVWEKTNIELIKELVVIAMPIAIGAFATTLMTLIDSLMIPNILIGENLHVNFVNELYGNYTSIWMLVNLPMALLISLSSNWLPKVSELKAKEELLKLKKYFDLGVKWTFYIVLPCTCGFFVLANEILKLVFPVINGAENLLKILSVMLLFGGINQLFVTTLQGLNLAKITVYNLIIASVMKIILNILFVTNLNFSIEGIAISSVVSYGFLAILNGRKALRFVGANSLIKETVKPLIASGVMSIFLIMLKDKVDLVANGKINTICIIFFSAIIYLTIILVLEKKSIIRKK
jgi:stage V sporulation protein B